ncbi:hypothetical protein [Streptomyces cahuitamycinicus]|uniref:hypothetical protein n=1 Tax=Streptomyces cahuitamycinicus TaxID=2070367 RepID=UPI0015E10156|nr:hypothetical protein [Streptomyces cahuitamycinicus]
MSRGASFLAGAESGLAVEGAAAREDGGMPAAALTDDPEDTAGAPAPPQLPAARAMMLLLHAILLLVWLGGCGLLLSKAGPVLHELRPHQGLGPTTGVVLRLRPRRCRPAR